jgi:hypothetical protein
MVWAGLQAYLLPKLKLFTNDNVKVNSIDELFDLLAKDETEPEKYNKQQQQPLRKSSCPGRNKSNFWPSISETKYVPKNPSKPNHPVKSSRGGRKDLPLSQCLSGEVNALQKANG